MAYIDAPHPVYCTTCDREADPGARFCDNCGAALVPQVNNEPPYVPGMGYQGAPAYGEAPRIPNYLVQAILVTICCCLPAGIVSIVFAAQVNGKVASGDYAEAQRLSNNARKWCWISLGLGIAILLIYGVFGILGAFSNFW